MLGPVELVLVVFFGGAFLLLSGLVLYLVESTVTIRGGRSFLALLVLMAAWAATAIGKVVLGGSVERFLVALELPMGVLFVVLFFVFTSQYTGRRWHARPPFTVALVAASAGLVLGLLTNPIHGLFWEGMAVSTDVFPHVVHVGLGPLYYLFVVLAYLLYGGAVYALMDIHLRSRYNTASIVLVAAGGSLPLLVNVISVFDAAPIPGLDYTPIGLAAFGIATTLSLKMDFLDIVPIARDTAVEQSAEGMIILDTERRIRDYNPTAARLIPLLDGHRNEPLTDVAPDADDWFDAADTSAVTLDSRSEEDRFLSVKTSAITDGGHHIGWTVVLTDVTDQERRRRHLELVSRVLRHNMANRIHTILGHSDVLASTLDESQRTHLKAIDDSATSIMETSAKLRVIQDIVTADAGRRSVDVSATVRAVVTRYSEAYPEATVTAEVPPSAVAYCGTGLEATIENLVENGLEHNSGPRPTVTATVTVTEDRVTVSVVDDGPGIPATERRILEAGETPLRHSSGVGLWLVHNFVEQSGDDLCFERRPDGGSEVSFALDRAPDDWAGTDAPQ